ncbi:MAG TPA: hypothetical protein VHZ55_28440 [Bryobacteraceae bacterium]|nr:hypothetical protein [Bryobacteraceae bacterium]
MKRVYQNLLRLYPADFQASFAAEMWNTFFKAEEEYRARGRLRFVHFALAELIGLVVGAATEWFSKWTTDRSLRGRSLPDLRMLRPPGAPQNLWFRGACASVSQGGIQDELIETEKRIETFIGHMVHAIANHDFPKARFYSDQERAAREHLRRLREMQSLDGLAAAVSPSD